MPTKVEVANDAVQQAKTRTEAEDVLKGCTLAVVRGVADLNYIDTEHGKPWLIRAIVNDVFGE